MANVQTSEQIGNGLPNSTSFGTFNVGDDGVIRDISDAEAERLCTEFPQFYSLIPKRGRPANKPSADSEVERLQKELKAAEKAQKAAEKAAKAAEKSQTVAEEARAEAQTEPEPKADWRRVVLENGEEVNRRVEVRDGVEVVVEEVKLGKRTPIAQDEAKEAVEDTQDEGEEEEPYEVPKVNQSKAKGKTAKKG